MKNTVIYLGGGNMSGVFGAGVVTGFQESEIYPQIESIYSTSAGTLNSAYFVSRQTRLGSSIYWENLSENFVSRKNFFVGLWQRFQNRFIKSVPSSKLRDALNMNYLMDIVENKKRLDTNLVLTQEIPVYAKLLDLDTHDIDYVDIRRPDILTILKMSASPFPYTHVINKIDGKRYIDAGNVEIIGISSLIKKHPNSRIVVAINQTTSPHLIYKFKNILEGKFMEWIFKDPRFYSIYARAQENFKKDISTIIKNPNIILITPPRKLEIASRATSREKLLKLYNAGIEIGKKIAKELD